METNEIALSHKEGENKFEMLTERYESISPEYAEEVNKLGKKVFENGDAPRIIHRDDLHKVCAMGSLETVKSTFLDVYELKSEIGVFWIYFFLVFGIIGSAVAGVQMGTINSIIGGFIFGTGYVLAALLAYPVVLLIEKVLYLENKGDGQKYNFPAFVWIAMFSLVFNFAFELIGVTKGGIAVPENRFIMQTICVVMIFQIVLFAIQSYTRWFIYLLPNKWLINLMELDDSVYVKHIGDSGLKKHMNAVSKKIIDRYSSSRNMFIRKEIYFPNFEDRVYSKPYLLDYYAFYVHIAFNKAELDWRKVFAQRNVSKKIDYPGRFFYLLESEKGNFYHFLGDSALHYVDQDKLKLLAKGEL